MGHMAKAKAFKAYTLTFYRPANRDMREIGPQVEIEERACTSMADANKTGRNHARGMGWRFIEAKLKDTSNGD
jgi:hypothetical protein